MGLIDAGADQGRGETTSPPASNSVFFRKTLLQTVLPAPERSSFADKAAGELFLFNRLFNLFQRLAGCRRVFCCEFGCLSPGLSVQTPEGCLTPRGMSTQHRRVAKSMLNWSCWPCAWGTPELCQAWDCAGKGSEFRTRTFLRQKRWFDCEGVCCRPGVSFLELAGRGFFCAWAVFNCLPIPAPAQGRFCSQTLEALHPPS